MEDRRPAQPRRGERLGPRERLRRGWEYRQVYDHGRAFHGRSLVVFVYRPPSSPRRAGFVAGRRVGHAVERNRARRLMRESYRRLKSSVPEAGVHLVFVAKPPCAEWATARVAEEMKALLCRAGLL